MGAEAKAAVAIKVSPRTTGGKIMPGFDRSGPMGTGPMTGGRRGFCGKTDSAEAGVSVAGNGLGRARCRGRFWGEGSGRGVGRGFGRTGAAPMRTASTPDELEDLTREAQNLEKNLQMIHKRMNELQPKSE